MTDIVERLAGPFMAEPAALKAMDKAADEIEHLRAEVEQLRAALEMFACDCAVHERCAVPDNCRNFQARRAALTTHKRTE